MDLQDLDPPGPPSVMLPGAVGPVSAQHHLKTSDWERDSAAGNEHNGTQKATTSLENEC